MKLAIQDGMLPGRTLAEKLDNAAAYGFQGIEIGGGAILAQFDEIARALEGHPVRLSTICSGYAGCLIDASKAERDRAVSDMIHLLDAGARLGAVGLICVPCFGGPRLPDLTPYMTAAALETELLADLLGPLADVAQKAGSLLLLEPLNRYETHLLNRLSDALDVVKRVGRKGLALMADVFHMNIEEDDLAHAILSAGKHLRHVHLADSQRLQPGTGLTDFAAVFKALKKTGFSDYMALECGIRGDRTKALPECVKFLKKQMR
jgi:sugar phosphate isomerase/epimerase